MTPADHRRPADVVLRRRRIRPETVELRPPRRRFGLRPTPWLVAGSFAAVIAVGTFLLSLPIAAESRDWTSGWDALFTAASAVCVTGLVRVDTSEHWSGFGEAVILGLFQAGGLGVTIYAGMLIMVAGQRFGLRGREFFGLELTGAGDWDVRRLLRRVLIFVLVTEIVTFVLLLPWFLERSADANAVWRSLFHAVSAFNNAGFDVMGGRRSMTAEIGSAYPIVVMGVAALLGSLSFVTVFDLRRHRRRWNLDTRVVVVGMVALLAVGMLIFAAGEVQGGHVLDGLGAVDVIANSFFLSVNRTTGMATVDMGAIRDVTAVVLLALMFIGGASTSNASGIKVGAFMVSVAVVLSSLRGRHRAELFGRELPPAIVLRAVAVVLLGVATVTAGVWALGVTDNDLRFLPTVFEVMSAAANVGWSQGVTAQLSTVGAMVLVALMFVGRLGPLMVALTVPERTQASYHYPAEGLRIG